jgi:hypothetical protein
MQIIFLTRVADDYVYSNIFGVDIDIFVKLLVIVQLSFEHEFSAFLVDNNKIQELVVFELVIHLIIEDRLIGSLDVFLKLQVDVNRKRIIFFFRRRFIKYFLEYKHLI